MLVIQVVMILGNCQAGNEERGKYYQYKRRFFYCMQNFRILISISNREDHVHPVFSRFTGNFLFCINKVTEITCYVTGILLSSGCGKFMDRANW